MEAWHKKITETQGHSKITQLLEEEKNDTKEPRAVKGELMFGNAQKF